MARRPSARKQRAGVRLAGTGIVVPPDPAEVLARRPLKYRNQPTTVDGIRFDSIKEADRYRDLAILLRAGKIADLRVHTRWPLVVNGLEVGVYEADFDYLPVLSGRPGGPVEYGARVVEDVKSEATKTRLYAVKRKLMLACHGITIVEV